MTAVELVGEVVQEALHMLQAEGAARRCSPPSQHQAVEPPHRIPSKCRGAALLEAVEALDHLVHFAVGVMHVLLHGRDRVVERVF